MLLQQVFNINNVRAYKAEFDNSSGNAQRQQAIAELLHRQLLSYVEEARAIHIRYLMLWCTAAADTETVRRLEEHSNFLNRVRDYARLEDTRSGIYHLARTADEFRDTVLEAIAYPKKMCPVRSRQPPTRLRNADVSQLQSKIRCIWAILVPFHCEISPAQTSAVAES